MSATLWTSDEDGIDLGPSMSMLAAFKELAQTSDTDYPELYGVPHLADADPVDPDWLKKVRKQAGQYLQEHGNELNEHSRWVLQQLAADQETPT